MWRFFKYKKIGKLFDKKDGSVNTVAMSLFAILVVSFVAVYFISNIVPIKKSTDGEAIARKYMLKMEQNGYLTSDNEAAMEKEFGNMGINNINITGTTLSQVNYGDDVNLCITYTYPIKSIVTGNGLIPSFQNENKTIIINKSSTSKKVN